MPDTDAISPTPPTPMDTALIEAINALDEALHESQQWNLDPHIFLWQPPHLAALALDSRIWQRADGHPAEVLGLIASQWDDVRASLLAQDANVFAQPPQGVALITEAWSLDLQSAIDRGDQAKVAEYNRAADMRLVHRHPDRVEVRTLAAVDSHMNVYTVLRMRDKDPLAVNGTVDGAVPDAMKAFVRFVNGQPPL